MTDEQIAYHSTCFFQHISRDLREKSEFEIERELRAYHDQNNGNYGFVKSDKLEFDLITSYLCKIDLVEIKEVMGRTTIYRLGQYGKDVINGKKKL